jgi:hypothetical protein
MYLFDEIIDRLKEELKLKTDRELYELMGVSQGVFSNWKTRNKIPYLELTTICFDKKIDLKYIINGEKDEKFEKKINYKEEITKKLEELKEKELKYFYHLIEAEITKKEL